MSVGPQTLTHLLAREHPGQTLPGHGPVAALLAQLTGHPTTAGAATAVRARPDLELT